MAAPPPASAPKTPNAFARSLGSVKVTVIRDSAAGAISAAKAPWRAREANSSSWLGARPPERGGPREAEQTEDERALAAGVVGDATAEQEQAAERQRVGGDHPLAVGVGDAEVALG